MKWKLLALFSSAICLLLVAGICIRLFLLHRLDSGFSSLNAPAVLAQVKRLDQLTTVKYSIQRVVGMRESKDPFGEESILLMVQGQALAGIDLSTLSPDNIRIAHNRAITLKLPPAKLLHVFLDEKQTKVWDRHITWWTPWVPFDPDLEHKARLTAEDDVRSAALKMGILEEARRNAETAIGDFLRALHVDVQFTCD